MSYRDNFARLVEKASRRVRTIPPSELGARVRAGATVLDVRDREEYQQWHIQGASNLSRGTLEMRIHELIPDKDTPIVCYCGGRGRGILAANTLQDLGYRNVACLAGGLRAYLDTLRR